MMAALLGEEGVGRRDSLSSGLRANQCSMDKDIHTEPGPGRITPRLPAREQPFLQRWFPGLHGLRECGLACLPRDFMAGLVLAAMLVPVGIAYAVAAGLPAINGLYATIVPLLAYALVGPSRLMVLGPDSALAGVILAVILPLSGGDPARAVALAGLMAIVAGLACVLAGVLRAGFVTELLSKPIRYGFMNGIVVTVVVSQLPALFGITIEGVQTPEKFYAFCRALAEGRADLPSLALGLATMAIIVLLRRWPRVPGMLVAVVVITAVTAALNLADQGVEVLGPMPQGLPALTLPWVTREDLVPIVMGGLAIALLSFSETSILSRTYAAKTRTYVDPNQEMVALGVANVAAGFFQGFPISSSSSRTPVAEAAGAQTQLTGVVGALAVAGLLLFAPDLLRNLPFAALAAIVITSVWSLLEIRDLRRIYVIQQWEFWLSVGCAAGVVVLGAIPGIGLAVLIAVIEFLWDGWRPHWAVLGRVDGVKGYHDLKRYPQGRQIPGLVLFRWDAPLFFANAELFQSLALGAVAASPTPVRWLVITAEPVTSVDVTAADMLVDLDAQLRAAHIELRFAEMKDPVKDKLRRFGLYARFGDAAFFPTIGQAVTSYTEVHDVDWTDWEDAAP